MLHFVQVLWVLFLPPSVSSAEICSLERLRLFQRQFSDTRSLHPTSASRPASPHHKYNRITSSECNYYYWTGIKGAKLIAKKRHKCTAKMQLLKNHSIHVSSNNVFRSLLKLNNDIDMSVICGGKKFQVADTADHQLQPPVRNPTCLVITFAARTATCGPGFVLLAKTF